MLDFEPLSEILEPSQLAYLLDPLLSAFLHSLLASLAHLFKFPYLFTCQNACSSCEVVCGTERLCMHIRVT